MDKYMIAFIGSGPASYVGAIKAARSGIPTCIIEKSGFGGVCLNTGCIPTKSFVASAKAIRNAGRAREFGFEIDGDIRIDMAALRKRKDRIVDIERKGLGELVRDSGVDIIEGTASFVDAHDLAINSAQGERIIFAKNTIIATGSVSASLPFMPFDGARVFSGEDILSLESIPSSMVIVGGGYIGCEYASLFATLGTKVTVIEALPRILSNADEEISEILARELKKDGVRVLAGRKIISAQIDGAVSVTLEDGTVVSADVALVAVGRKAYTAGLSLENAGVNVRKNGAVEVNNEMMTTTQGIYAVGDVAGEPMLAHVASAECRVAVENALGKHLIMDYSVIPSAIFTHPEIGGVGLTEAEARAKGMDVRVGRVLMRSLGISHAAGEISGMAKIICDSISDAVVGVHIIGERATDLIHEAALALFQGLSASTLSRMVHAHPTFSEILSEAALDTLGDSIYSAKPRKA
ncbi:MAG: dihydrolipoyl dehydrogenase [Actinobacteria bacterium]|nr:dihydrolipoyl dehydrogenase [Actinomycetota bacterium]